MDTIITDISLLQQLEELQQLRLLQLSSPSLPVGSYAFSFGLEKAVDDGWVQNPDALEQWLREQLLFSQARVDVPLMLRLHEAFARGDERKTFYWNDYLLACRESSELRLSDTAQAQALLRLFPELGIARPQQHEWAFQSLFVKAAVHWKIAARHCLLAYLWSWLDNQVIAATKLLPLGQSRAQALLGQVLQEIPGVISTGTALEDGQIGACLPALAITSGRHETQYSRLFRS